MRYLLASFVFCFCISCVCKKETVSKSSTKGLNTGLMQCPDNGNCVLELLKNKALLVKKDNLGDTYLEIVDGENVILEFEYKKFDNPDVEDDSYREEIFIELNPKALEIETDLSKESKVFFAKWCNCEEETGYYKIEEGQLNVNKVSEGMYQLTLNFKTDKVSHIIKSIDRTFSIQ